MANPWDQTYTGKAFDLVELDAKNVDPLDIAVSLARKPRYSGFTMLVITVGQHCVMGAAAVYRAALAAGASRDAARYAAGLFVLHDAAEAYIGDVLGPARAMIKRMCTDLVFALTDSGVKVPLPPGIDFDLFAQLEAKVSRVIYQYFGIDVITPDEHAMIVRADRRQLLFEKTWFVQVPEPKPWGVDGNAFDLREFGGGLDSPANLKRAAVCTGTWTTAATIGAYLITLEHVGLLPTWTSSPIPAALVDLENGAYIVNQLFPDAARTRIPALTG